LIEKRKAMNKFSKAVRAVSQLLRKPYLLNLVLNEDSQWEAQIKKSYGYDQALPVVDFMDVCNGSNLSLNTFSFLGGGSLPTDILLLKSLSAQISNCRYFEIGTWRGESVSNVADTGAECYTLNLSNEEIVALTGDKRYADLHGFFSHGRKNIHHLFGNSKAFNFGQFEDKFDLIFIDGDHQYDFVKNDTAKVFENLVHDDSIVVWHDYAYHPERVRPEVLAGILDGLPQELHQYLYHVSNTMCAVFTKQKFQTFTFESPAKPRMVYKVEVSIK
jgi:predicted O-methyltransferase YrrM